MHVSSISSFCIFNKLVDMFLLNYHPFKQVLFFFSILQKSSNIETMKIKLFASE